MFVPLLVALVLAVIWRWLDQPKVDKVASQRTITDFVVSWRCDQGHSFTAAGQVGSRACPTCGQPALPVEHYVCPEHGVFDAFIELAADSDPQRPRAKRYHLPGAPWQDIHDGVRCPKCSAPAKRLSADPLTHRKS